MPFSDLIPKKLKVAVPTVALIYSGIFIFVGIYSGFLTASVLKMIILRFPRLGKINIVVFMWLKLGVLTAIVSLFSIPLVGIPLLFIAWRRRKNGKIGDFSKDEYIEFK